MTMDSNQILTALQGMAPRDPSAINPATTDAMARSRDAITKVLERQLGRQAEPFAGLNDVATAATAALATRGRTPFGQALEQADLARAQKTAQVAGTLGTLATKEAALTGRGGISPYQNAQLMLQNIKFQASRGDHDARLVEQFIDNARASLDNDSSIDFLMAGHSALQEHQRALGRPLNGQESVAVLSNVMRSNSYKTKAPDTLRERQINQLAMFRERIRRGETLTPLERDQMSAIENELTKYTPVGDQGLIRRDSMAPLQGGTSSAPTGSSFNVPQGMADIFQRVSQETGVSPDILQKIAHIESRFNPGAVSPKGALGVMQVMPATGAGMGFSLEQLNDPAQNIRAGAMYYKQMLDQFGGNPVLAAIAYNGGPGRAQQFIQSGGDWNVLPEETRRYAGLFLTSGMTPPQQQPGAAGAQRQQALNNLPPNVSVAVPPASKPPSQATQDDLQSIAVFSRAIPMLEAGINESVPGIGHAFGPLSDYGLMNNERVRNFQAALNTLRVQAQSIVKGTPSNFDIQTVVAMFPNLGLSKDTNKIRVQFLKEAFGEALKIRLGSLMGSQGRMEIPGTMIEAAKNLGVSMSEIVPITPDEAVRRWSQWDATMNGATQLFGQSNAARKPAQDLKKKYGLE